MGISPEHAFGSGGAYPRPGRRFRTRAAAAGGAVLQRMLTAHRVAKAWRAFDAAAVVGDDCLLGPSAWCVNSGQRERIEIGAGSIVRGTVRRELFGDGHVTIGREVYVGDDCLISCSERVEIGDGTLLAHGVQIFDNASHPLEPEGRLADWRAVRSGSGARGDIPSEPVRIGANAWVGMQSLVLMGVEIGSGAIVAAGSVVTRDVPPGKLAAGSPATVVADVNQA
jgi:acetyltransferase-like isoleucine patch superfamily enzyme